MCNLCKAKITSRQYDIKVSFDTNFKQIVFTNCYLDYCAFLWYSVVLQGGAPMRNILEELWYGNICPNIGCRESTSLAKQLMGYIADHHDNLQATLTEEQKEVLEKFDDCYAELTDINEREIFAYAFRLGARIMLEVMLPQAEE